MNWSPVPARSRTSVCRQALRQTFRSRDRTLFLLSGTFGIQPQDHYAAVRAMQAAFDSSALLFSDEYYDVLGLENPRHPEEQEHTGGCAMADVQDFFFNREE